VARNKGSLTNPVIQPPPAYTVAGSILPMSAGAGNTVTASTASAHAVTSSIVAGPSP
jgi:hypothetical protein